MAAGDSPPGSPQFGGGDSGSPVRDKDDQVRADPFRTDRYPRASHRHRTLPCHRIRSPAARPRRCHRWATTTTLWATTELAGEELDEQEAGEEQVGERGGKAEGEEPAEAGEGETAA